MKIKLISLTILIITFINVVAYIFPNSAISQKPAQLIANYIAVEDIEGQTILAGEVVGKPEVSDKGVTGILRVKNNTDWWIGLELNKHHATYESVGGLFGAYSSKYLLVSPQGYADYRVHFELEDDFITFVFSNKLTGASFVNSVAAFVDAFPGSELFPKEKEIIMMFELLDTMGSKFPDIASGSILTIVGDKEAINILYKIIRKHLGNEAALQAQKMLQGVFIQLKLLNLSKRIAWSWIIGTSYFKNGLTAPSVTFRGLRIGNRTVSEQNKLPCTYYVPEEPGGFEKIKKTVLFWIKEKPMDYKEKYCRDETPKGVTKPESENTWKKYEYSFENNFGDGRRIKGTASFDYPASWNMLESNKSRGPSGEFIKIVTISHPQNKCEAIFPLPEDADDPFNKAVYILQHKIVSKGNLLLIKYFYALKSDKYKEKELPATEIYAIPENIPDPPLKNEDIIGAGVLFIENIRNGKTVDLETESSGGILNIKTKEKFLSEECKSVMNHMIDSIEFSSIFE